MITDPHTEKVRKENEELKERLAALEAKLEKAQEAAPKKWVGELPRYKLIKPFYGPDDVLYDPEEPGFDAIDWTGVPNHEMEPINEPAKKRMEAWLRSLPGGKDSPNMDEMSQAAYMHRPREGQPELPMRIWTELVQKTARELMYQRLGTPSEEQTLELPHKYDNIPVMGNEQRAQKRKARGDMLKSIPVDPEKQKTQTRVIMPNANVDNSTSSP